MTCKNCGAQVPQGKEYCPVCGARVAEKGKRNPVKLIAFIAVDVVLVALLVIIGGSRLRESLEGRRSNESAAAASSAAYAVAESDEEELPEDDSVGWQWDDTGWRYRYDDGSYACADWALIDDDWYYFDDQGYMVTGWLQLGETWYYLDPYSGIMACDETLTIEGVNYTFDSSGALVSSIETTESTDESEFILPDSSTDYLTRDEVEALSTAELRLARNEIYARLGRRFKDSELDSYFRSKSWYDPRYDPDEFDSWGTDVLNDYERYNLELILSVEETRR